MWQLGFSLLGKYPLNMGRVTVFPLLGINYNLVLSMKDKDGTSIEDSGSGYEASDFSQFGILAGGGLDFPLSGALFFRAEAFFELRFASKVMDDVKTKMATLITMMMPGAVTIDTTLGMGPRFKIGLGYKF